ncbi:MAG: KH domain-containing protein [Lachnospirales bacterium]
MKELLEIIAKNLVDNPNEVSVNERMDDDVLVLELTVSQDDIGKVIGKRGRIANAIRTFIKSAAAKENKKVVVKIM